MRVLLLALFASLAAAQKFEVASIKRCAESDRTSGGAPSPGRLELSCQTTATLIRLAYLVFPTGQPNAPVSPSAYQQPISGAPSWVDSERYRISAKAEAPTNMEMLRGPMLQKLLEDRFQLKLHRESREVDAFAITAGKGGPQLPAARPGACVVSDRNHPTDAPNVCGRLQRNPAGGFDAPGVTLPDLCRQLEALVEREIVDRTGLSGLFDVHLDLTSADLGIPGATPDPTSDYVMGDGRAIAAALAKIGLQMRPAKSTAEFIVIDRVER